MNARHPAGSAAQWTDANQRVLVAELARIKLLLGPERPTAAVDRGTVTMADSALEKLVAAFGLSAFERDILLLAAGVEMDSEIAALCATGQGTPHRPWATFGLAMAALPEAHWSALAPTRPLRRWRLLDIDDGPGLTQGRLRIDERVLHFLAGIGYLDRRLRAVVRRLPVPALLTDGHRSLASSVAEALRLPNAPVIQLHGRDSDSSRDVAAAAAEAARLLAYVLRCEDIPADAAELDAFAALCGREGALHGALLVVEAGETAAARRLAERIAAPLILVVAEPLSLARAELGFAVAKPDAADRRNLWLQALGGRQCDDALLDLAVAEYRLSARDVGRAAARLPAGIVDAASLAGVCRGFSAGHMRGLAQPVEAVATWADIVLPAPQLSALRQIGQQMRHRVTVFERWGFASRGSRGQGLAALFAGESGTGKTMAAEVLANDLGLELFRIDLSAIVSKYIGETEKNLARVFDAAEDTGAILLFDEADALFGKRSEVRDSHDRYANIEVSYLLQRMEGYRGLAILTTNQKSALDAAFHRRLRFVVNFPFPETAEREAIWRRAFPAAAPVEALDFVKLARLQMAGGNIRNIALGAAFRAADASRAVTMDDVLHAAHDEAAKRERPLSDAEIKGWR